MRVPVPAEIRPPESLGRVHFVGVGGAALSGLARIMCARGVPVSGSDSENSPMLESLQLIGVTCWVGHDASHVDAADTVVVSTAVREDNPEVRAAYQRRLPVWPRSAAVQSVLLGRTAVVVTGTHGKTTTTAMLTTALLACGADPSYAIGSTLSASGLNAADGGGPLFIAEGDESDEAIAVYTPHGAVITNVDADHLDHYGDADAYAEIFSVFLERIQPGGFVVCCVDDPGAERLARRASERLRVVRVGLSATVDIRAEAVAFAGTTSRFDVWHGGRRLGTVRLRVPGEHYVTDALAALAAGLELGFDFQKLAGGLAGFRGSSRRMEFKGSAAGVGVYDSYAHHPAEIAADLKAARTIAGDGRLVVCFQPHMYSRTRIFGEAMGEALGAADRVVVMEIYPAREDPEPGVTAASVAEAVPLPADDVVFEPARSRAADRTVELCGSGDVVLTLGAGDVTEVAPEVLQRLRTREAEG